MGKAVYQFRNAAKDVQSEIMQSANEIRKEASAIRLDQMDIEEDHPTSERPRPIPQKRDTPSQTPAEPCVIATVYPEVYPSDMPPLLAHLEPSHEYI